MSDKKKTVAAAVAILCLSLLIPFFAAGVDAAEKGDRRLIGNFIQDGEVLESHWGEGQIIFDDFENGSVLKFLAAGAFRVTNEIEVGLFIPFARIDPDDFDSEFGLVNIPVYAKYRFITDPCDLSAGLTIELPSGDDDLWPGQRELHLDGFLAMRCQVPTLDIQLVGSTGIRYNSDAGDWNIDGKTAFFFNAGAIFGITDQLDLSGELLFATQDYDDTKLFDFDPDISLLFGGHFAFSSSVKFRGGLQFGLTDGAPDVGLIGSVVYQF